MRRFDHLLASVLGAIGGQQALFNQQIDQRERASAGIPESRASPDRKVGIAALETSYFDDCGNAEGSATFFNAQLPMQGRSIA